MKKRLLSAALALAMLLGSAPVPVYAQEPADGTAVVQQADPDAATVETADAEPTATPAPSGTPAPTQTPEPSETPAPTATLSPTETPAPAKAPAANSLEAAASRNVTSWEWIGADNLNEGVLALPGVSAANPVDFDAVVSMLPTGVTATVDGSEEPVELTITWACEDFPAQATQGEYTFMAALPEGYTLSEETASLTVPVILGLGLLPVTALAADEVSYLAYS